MPRKGNKQNNQNVPKIKGRGDYYSDRVLPIMQQLVPKGTFAAGGQYLGSAGGAILDKKYGNTGLASQAGNKVGRYLGQGLSRLVGFGDYSVKTNSLFKEGLALQAGEAVPSFGMMGSETRVRHREYLGEITVPVSPLVFTNTSYTINPGSSSTFPWLSALAQNYQQYKVYGLVFEFKTLSSDITAGGALGSVIMATNYDVLDSTFADKIHMENAQFSVSAKPSCSQLHTIECNPAQSSDMVKYIRDDQSSSTTSQDARLYDLGNFQIATQGLPGSAGAVLGELWCTYDIGLFKPEIVDRAIASGKALYASSTKTNLFSNAATVTGNCFTVNTNTITFTRIGQYMFSIKLVGTGIAIPGNSGTATISAKESVVNSASTEGDSVWTVNATAVSQTFILDASNSTTVTSVVVRAGSYLVSLA